jgi:hypothetical protein
MAVDFVIPSHDQAWHHSFPAFASSHSSEIYQMVIYKMAGFIELAM